MSRSKIHNHDASRNTASDKPSLRQRMSQDLQLRGKAQRTHDGYLREVRKLACYFNSPPDRLSDQQVGKYLLDLINDCNFAPGSLGVAYSGIKCFWTVYSLGLRLEEALNLQVGDLDSQRMMVQLHRDKGAKDRYLPLPVPYYLVPLAVPKALRRMVRANQAVCYQALFAGGSQTIRDLASGPRFIGTDRMGFFAALHTWGRDPMVYHPHVHFVVPGGGVSEDAALKPDCAEPSRSPI